MRRYIVAILFLLTAIMASCAKKGTVVVRCDDIRLTLDSQTIAMLRLFEKYNVRITCAVIPFDKNGMRVEYDAEKLEYVKSLQRRGIVEIALHGYAHRWTGTRGEVDGLPYTEQYWKLKAGKEYLDSLFETDVSTFIPPRNYYDSATVKVLEVLNFRTLSASSSKCNPLISSGLRYIPFSCGNLTLFDDELRSSQEEMIVLMFHPSEFKNGYTLAKLEENLKYISSNGIQSLTMTQAADEACRCVYLFHPHSCK